MKFYYCECGEGRQYPFGIGRDMAECHYCDSWVRIQDTDNLDYNIKSKKNLNGRKRYNNKRILGR